MDKTITLLSDVRVAVRNGSAKQIRVGAGLSQSDVARAIGVTPATVNRWESLTRTPTGDSAIRYARLLRLLASKHANAA